MNVEIVRGPETGVVGTTRERTSVSQGDKLELTMKNLCYCLGIKKIYWIRSSREAKFYRPEGPYIYQSASNIILELSEELVKKHGGSL